MVEDAGEAMKSPSRRVLLVDDEPEILKLLSTLLEHHAFEVLTASTGEEALEILRASRVGVAVVDKNLPGDLDGLDVLREARRAVPFIRVLMHTAFASKESAVEALRLGAVDYLEKPTELRILVEKVRQAFESYEVEVARSELMSDYETLFEVVPNVVWFVAKGGNFRRISKRGARLLGYEPEEMVGRSYESIINATEDADVQWAFKERRTGDRATQGKRVSVRTKSGRPRVLEFYSAGSYEPAHEDGRPIYRGTLAVGVDVTEHLAIVSKAEQIKKMDALGRLAGGVAHDFNNLLSVILTSLEFLREGIPPEDELREDVDEIEKASKRAADLSRQLLTFSRAEVVEAHTIDVAAFLADMHRMLSRLIREDVQLEMDVSEEVAHVLADPGQLQQVIVNLAVNARDAMPQGGTLTIGARNVQFVSAQAAVQKTSMMPGEYVLIEVIDTGEGMSEDTREHLFEPFFTTKDVNEGTGLGMAIVYGIVNRMGGHVAVDSEVGKGTKMSVWLPQMTGEETVKGASSICAPLVGSEHVLVVEDEDPVRKVLVRILNRHGYRTTEARSAGEALELCANLESLDLLVTDIVMPGGSGAELARRLRERRADLPVLYLSGYAGSGAQLDGLLKERATFVPKPFTAQSLLSAVRQLLEGRSVRPSPSPDR